jgi:hypothetical protein
MAAPMLRIPATGECRFCPDLDDDGLALDRCSSMEISHHMSVSSFECQGPFEHLAAPTLRIPATGDFGFDPELDAGSRAALGNSHHMSVGIF